MRFAYNNLLDIANSPNSTLNASNEYSTNYIVENVYHSHLSKKWRSESIANKILNGNCESLDPPTLDSNVEIANCTFTRSAFVRPSAGTYSYLLTKTTAAGAGAATAYLVEDSTIIDLRDILPGMMYNFSSWIYSDVATLSNAKFIIQEYYSASWHESVILSPTIVSTWQNKISLFKTNDSATGFRLLVSIDTSEDAAKVFYVDSLELYIENRITFDSGVSGTISPMICLISSHNISSNATIKIQGNATTDWTSPTVNETISYNSGHMLKIITGSALRYWSLLVEDRNNTDGYIQLGYFFLGDYLSFATGAALSFPYEIKETDFKETNPTGQVYGIRTGVKLDGFSLNFPWLTNAEKNTITTMYNVVRNTKPFYAIIDENNTSNLPPIYCTIEDIGFDHICDHGTEMKWSGKIKILEAK